MRQPIVADCTPSKSAQRLNSVAVDTIQSIECAATQAPRECIVDAATACDARVDRNDHESGRIEPHFHWNHGRSDRSNTLGNDATTTTSRTIIYLISLHVFCGISLSSPGNMRRNRRQKCRNFRKSDQFSMWNAFAAFHCHSNPFRSSAIKCGKHEKRCRISSPSLNSNTFVGPKNRLKRTLSFRPKFEWPNNSAALLAKAIRRTASAARLSQQPSPN